MLSVQWRAVYVGTGALLAWIAPAIAAADAPLRHQLRVGDWLVYERRAATFDLTGSRPAQRERSQIQVWCFEQQADKRLVQLDLLPVTADGTGRLDGALLEIDTRGERRLTPAAAARIAGLDAAFEVVPVLRSALEFGDAWASPPDAFGRVWHCLRTGPDPQRDGLFRIEFTIEDPIGVAAAFGIKHTGVVWFDATDGIVRRVESQVESPAANARIEAVTTLRHRTSNEDRWCSLRAAEARRYLQTLDHEDGILDAISRRPESVDRQLDRLDRLWAAAAVDMDAGAKSPVRLLAESRRRQMSEQAARIRQCAAYTAQWLGQPAGRWSLQTPAGDTTSSESLAGTVIECFWSSESAAAMRVLEPLRHLQAELGEQPATIVCLNLDADFARATRAV